MANLPIPPDVFVKFILFPYKNNIKCAQFGQIKQSIETFLYTLLKISFKGNS